MTDESKILPGAERTRKGMFGVNIGLFANTFLAIIKTVVGLTAHSPALLADGINSISDVAYGIVVKIFMQISARPADKEHPYGHDRMESIAAVAVGSFIMATGISIFWSAISSVIGQFRGTAPEHSELSLALYVAVGTIVLKLFLWLYTRRLGRESGNNMLLVLATDHRNDTLSSFAAALGIFFSREGYPWVDPLAGAVVAIIILFTGIDIVRDASTDLMNSSPGAELTERIRNMIKEIPQVIDVEEITGHRFGVYIVLNVVIGVHPTLWVAEGNVVATRVEKKIMSELDIVRRVFVHYHPAKCFRNETPPQKRCIPLTREP
ncbi:cation transporter [Desulforhopalus vacuolatus]|uniref:cation diffusion facilitator family transporter n=1 Tax=Desulforhopalus vacuolatus TaxID=40414 RepID=UPI00196397A7|nr:cation diffusion facilitator family transporter [Desulforhopalus vacuolatus]MBM9519456.1 cation transporter [Desulforhopalus vacuolatus]